MSGSWEPDYAFRGLFRILFIFRRVMFDDAYRREYSDQSKAILWALEFTIDSAQPHCLCSRSSRKSALLEICFLVQRNLVTNICTIKIIRNRIESLTECPKS